MAWKGYAPKTARKYSTKCAVGLGRGSLALTDRFVDVIGARTGPKKVIIMLDEEMEKIGLWFFDADTKIPSSDGFVYTVRVLKTENVCRITCSKLLRDEPWLAKFRHGDSMSYYPASRGTIENGNDFYVVDLQNRIE